MSNDYFKHKAEGYEKNKSRVDNVSNIANAVINNVKFDKSMHIMDFGSGTGLLLEKVAPLVKKITAVDISTSMNQQLRDKKDKIDCELDILEIDLTKIVLDQKYDGIISSMTMHHVENIESMFEKMYSMLNEHGFIAIADLDEEDGSFHTEDTGVFHFGFSRDAISDAAAKAGFKNIEVTLVSTIQKPQKNYSVFLLVATK